MKDIFTALNINITEVEKSETLTLSAVEKIFFHLNKRDNYFFRIPAVPDLMTIFRSFKDEDCIKKLADCTESVVGNVIKTRTIEIIPESTFQTQPIYKSMQLGHEYILDFVLLPEVLEAKEREALTNLFNKFLVNQDPKTKANFYFSSTVPNWIMAISDYIHRKRELLHKIGYKYFIHYDPDKLIDSVILDGG